MPFLKNPLILYSDDTPGKLALLRRETEEWICSRWEVWGMTGGKSFLQYIIQEKNKLNKNKKGKP